MTAIDLVYSRDCPNVAAARASLLRAFAETGRTPRWREWLNDGADTPAHLRGLASPAIVVGRTVVGGTVLAEAASCRLYRAADGGLAGAPDASAIAAALAAPGDSGGTAARGTSLLTALPAFGAALAPKLTCALCWPAYSGLLASLGVGFVDYTPWLLPAAIVSLAVFLVSLARTGRRTGRTLPLAVGLLGAAAFLGGEFALALPPLTWAGGAALVAATGLSLWWRRAGPACPIPGAPAKEAS